jgi:DNA-binding response OmpR family regulator
MAFVSQVIPGNVLPVIMVSAKSDEENIVEGLRSGSNDFVRKPYQREELLARIEAQLRLKSDTYVLLGLDFRGLGFALLSCDDKRGSVHRPLTPLPSWLAFLLPPMI